MNRKPSLRSHSTISAAGITWLQKQCSSLLMLLLLLLSNTSSYAQTTVTFRTREVSALPLPADSFKLSPASVLYLSNDARSSMLSDATFGNYVKYKANQTQVRLRIQHNAAQVPSSPYVYMICYKIEGCYSMRDSVYTTIATDTLVVACNPDSLTAYQDMQVKQYPKLYQAKVTLLACYNMTSGTPVAMTPPLANRNFYLELAMLYQPYTKFPYLPSEMGLNTSSAYDATRQQLRVNWTLAAAAPKTYVSPPTPQRYELEWTYVDNYAAGGGSLPASALSFDFKHNATRVTADPDSTAYNIPVIYPKGYIVYRVRMVRVDSVRYQYPIYGPWSLADKGLVSSVPATAQYLVTAPHSGDSLNWNYTISFAEWGKYKHVLSYFDGMLKNRQTITRFNTSPAKLLATENIYDYEGRRSITTLPTVIGSNRFGYQQGVSVSSITGMPYAPVDFDQKPALCPDETLIPPFSNASLANAYYSNLNTDTAAWQKFVPQAEGYPFVHSMLTPGFSDRVDKQGGAGPLLQVSVGHETKNEYVAADQADLNQLFGINAGISSFYTKTMTKDPNGQYSMLVRDYRGRQMVSSLVGASVDISRHAILFNDEVPMGARFRENKLANPALNTIDATGRTKTYAGTFYMDFAAMSVIKYEYDFKPYPVCSSPFLGLSVKGHYDYTVTDDCGILKLHRSGDIGTTGVTTVASPPPATTSDTLSLEKGKYSVKKELTLSVDEAYAAVDSFMTRDPNCLKTENDFIKEAVDRTNYPCAAPDPCGELAKSMMEELFTNAKYGGFSRGSGLVVGTGPAKPSIYDFPQGGRPGATGPYRYQSGCVSAALDSLVITRYGVTYRHIGYLPVDTFMMLYTGDNRYKIAAVLLPLHPEYCRLQGCFVDTFEAAFNALPDAATAQQYGMFKLPDIIARDKQLTDRMAAYPVLMVNPADSLSRLAGGDRGRLDTLAAQLAYCSSDDMMAYEYANRRFRSDIVALNFPNSQVRDRYFDKLRTLYLSTRAKYNSIVRTAGGNKCEPCSNDTVDRMHLINPPLVPVIYNTDGSFASGPGSLKGMMGDTSSLMEDILRGGARSGDTAWVRRMNDSAKAMAYAADTMSSRVAADSIMARLANCYSTTAAQKRLHDSLMVFVSSGAVHNGLFQPAQVGLAIRQAGLSINDLCHPYLVSYDYYGEGSAGRNNCSAPALYTATRDFLNSANIAPLLATAGASPVITSLPVWDNTNLFAAKISGYLSTSAAIYATSRYSAADSTYYLGFFRYLGTDTLMITLRSPGIFRLPSGTYGLFAPSPGGTVSVDNVSCYFEDPSAAAEGYIGRFMFRVQVKRSDMIAGVTYTRYAPVTAWNSTLLMNEQGSSTIGNSVPYTQFRSEFKRFGDTMTALGSYAADHPMFWRSLRNFMNSNLKRSYSEEQYTRFLQSSALADSMLIPMYGGYARIGFPAGAYADFPAFAAAIAASDSFDVRLQLDLKYGTSRQEGVIDYNTIPYNKIALFNTKFAAIGGLLKYSVPVRGFLFVPAGTATAPLIAGTAFSLLPQNDFDIKPSYYSPLRETYNYYHVANAGLSPAELSQQLDRLQQNLVSLGINAYWLPNSLTTVNIDYYNPRKQALLSYIYGMQGWPAGKVLDTMQTAYLKASIAAFSGSELRYGDPENPDRFTDLYYSSPAYRFPAFDTMSRIVGYVGTKRGSNQVLLPAGVRTYPVSGGTVPADASFNVYRCGDGLYWYRYFGTKKQLFNIFIRVPLYIPESVHPRLQLLGFVPGIGDSASRNCTALLREPGKTDTLRAAVTTDFDICWSSKLQDVLLGNEAQQPDRVTPASGEAGAEPNCEQLLLANNIYEGKINYYNYFNKFKKDLQTSFVAYLMSQVKEKLWIDYANMRFGTTLYSYDLAGNLIRTVPPAGVVRLDSSKVDKVDSFRANKLMASDVLPQHQRDTRTEYNSLNKPVWEQTPDAGTRTMYYDLKGNVLLAQDARQGRSGLYSYFLYDRQNRLTETGEVRWDTCAYFNPVPFFIVAQGVRTETPKPNCGCPNYADSVWEYCKPINNFYNDSAFNVQVRTKNRTQVVYHVYDAAFTGLDSNRGMSRQQNLRGRIAASMYYDTVAAGLPGRGYDHAVHYSYDAAGNLRTLSREFPQLEVMRQRFKRIDYEYDLLSGKINTIAYNRGWGDQFYQRYAYDADNRLTRVETSQDGMIWKLDARYNYYQHGPLARVVLGDQSVQGLDYAYTLQGWLKSINGDRADTTLDMGGDGKRNNTTVVLRDMYATTLDYFAGDYKPIGRTQLSRLPVLTKNLYNGNIARISNDVQPFGALTAAYTYDQMNRLRFADYAPTTTTPLVFGKAYASAYKYDQDGNLTQLTRREGSGTLMDSLVYVYPNAVANNKLSNVLDYASFAATGVEDLKQYTTPGAARLLYNDNGQVTKDLMANQDSIRWNIYGKSTDMLNRTTNESMHFGYDAQGLRTYKSRSVYVGTSRQFYNTYYVREAGGNILAEYTLKIETERKYPNETFPIGGLSAMGTTVDPTDPAPAPWIDDPKLYDLSLASHHIYGSSRLGLVNYWPLQYRILRDLREPYKTDTLASVRPRAWYNGVLNELILPDSMQAYGNPLSFSTYAQFLLGQRQYELTNHLGNVQVALSDKRTTKTVGTAVSYFNAGITAAYDYYPYGQLMPGRYVADNAQQCAMVTMNRSVPYKSMLEVNPVSGAGSSGVTVAAATATSCGTGAYKQADISGKTGSVTYTLTTTPNVGFRLELNVPYLIDNVTVTVSEVRSGTTTTLYSQILTGGTFGIRDVSTDITPQTGTVTVNLSVTLFRVLPSLMFTVGCIKYEQLKYSTENSLVQICSGGTDKYEFGYNGQMKMNEVAGTGNWNTAEFWEYGTREAQRKNPDPVKHPNLSPYSVFNANPILNNDVNGDIFDVANNKQTTTDVQSLVSKDNQKYLDIKDGHVNLNWNGISKEEQQAVLAKDEGLNLVNDLVTSDKKFLYEASDIALHKDESGNNTVSFMYSRDYNIVNASNFGKDANGKHTDRPKAGYDGQVVLHPQFKMYELNLGGTKVVKPRANTVFHELAENYERTHLNIDYQGRDGAHNGASLRELKWDLRSNTPGSGIGTDRLLKPDGNRMLEISDMVKKYMGY